MSEIDLNEIVDLFITFVGLKLRLPMTFVIIKQGIGLKISLYMGLTTNKLPNLVGWAT